MLVRNRHGSELKFVVKETTIIDFIVTKKDSLAVFFGYAHVALLLMVYFSYYEKRIYTY